MMYRLIPTYMNASMELFVPVLHIDAYSHMHYTCTTCMNFCLFADPCGEVTGTVLQYVALGNDTTLPVPNGLELVSRLGYVSFAR